MKKIFLAAFGLTIFSFASTQLVRHQLEDMGKCDMMGKDMNKRK